MKSFLLLSILFFSIFSFAQDIRVFFFNETQEGARFRLQCLQSDNANRCNESAFGSKGKELCEQAGMKLSVTAPFSCVNHMKGSSRLCKYANGECSKDPNQKVQVVDPLPTDNSQLPEAKDLPEVKELPSTHSLPEVKDLPQAKDYGPIR